MRISGWSSDVCSSDLTHGAKLRLADGPGAKLTPESIAAALDGVRDDVHQVQPHAVSITNATEYGLAYTPAEVAAIGALCTQRGLGLHMDGARFANAIAHLGCAPADVTWRSGVAALRSEEPTSELQSLMRISYAVFCLKKNKRKPHKHQ